MKAMKTALAVAVPAALLCGAFLFREEAAAADGAPGSVTFLMGEATRSAGGKTEALKVGSTVSVNDLIETKAKTRMELKLPDQSVMRIGPQSKVQLSSAVFGKSVEERKVSAKLVVGTIWAKVAHAVGGDAKFEVHTDNAVAGVRGTTFRVDAKTDKSCVVKVYAGTVAVAPGASVPRPKHGGEEPKANPKEHKQVPGPAQITREQWEKLVSAMMQVKIAADGTPSELEPFQLASSSEDEWEDWNRQRDADEKPKGG